MMKSFKYSILFFLTLALTLTSCNDSFLDSAPDERVEITTTEQVVQLVTSAYPTANYAWIGEISSDNMIDNNAPHLPASTNSKQIEAHYNYAPYDRMDDELFAFEPVRSSNSWDSPYMIWDGFYEAIATANHAIKYAEDIIAKEGQASSKLKSAIAEARLIRAYSHFILVNLFSQAYKDEKASQGDIGIPYVTEPETKLVVTYERGTVADVYEKIEKDIEAALADITDENFANPIKWHFNVNAAHAFAARFYLFERKYDKVIEHANAVLGTNEETALQKMMRYDGFDDCYYLSDYGKVWQNPSSGNNLMLISTNSIYKRRAVGYRYSTNSLAAREIFYHSNNALWRSWAINPTAYIGGYTFGRESYGYVPSKTAEEFEYSDKVAGIGYPHTIRREFTGSQLMLERAEAKAMTGDYAGAAEDLVTYDKSLLTFSTTGIANFYSNNRMAELTPAVILSWFGNGSNYNCFDNWDFTQRMSSDFIVPADAVPYMNCINYFRRFETWGNGDRFFDLKRFGIEYSHKIGVHNEEIWLTWNDPNRAIEIPQDAIAAGMQPSRPVITEETEAENVIQGKKEDFVIKN